MSIKIGFGTFSQVYCENNKAIKISNIYDFGTFLMEINMLTYLDHKNIIKVSDIVLDKDCKIIMPKYNLNLKDFIDNSNSFKTKFKACLTYNIAKNISDGLAYLHGKHVIHSDLKLENILINGSYNAVICDFGISIIDFSYKYIGSQTNYVRAPEHDSRFVRAKITNAIDVWSLGCIMFYLLTKRLINNNELYDSSCINLCKFYKLPRPIDAKSYEESIKSLTKNKRMEIICNKIEKHSTIPFDEIDINFIYVIAKCLDPHVNRISSKDCYIKLYYIDKKNRGEFKYNFSRQNSDFSTHVIAPVIDNNGAFSLLNDFISLKLKKPINDEIMYISSTIIDNCDDMEEIMKRNCRKKFTKKIINIMVKLNYKIIEEFITHCHSHHPIRN